MLYQKRYLFIYFIISKHNCRPCFFCRNARLQLTDQIIGEFNGRDQDTEGDLQRIKELLSQPRNEELTEES